MRFKEGDIVRVVKPQGIQYEVSIPCSTSGCEDSWVDDMDKMSGMTFELVEFYEGCGWQLQEPGDCGGIWSFLEDWLEPIDTEETSK